MQSFNNVQSMWTGNKKNIFDFQKSIAMGHIFLNKIYWVFMSVTQTSIYTQVMINTSHS